MSSSQEPMEGASGSDGARDEQLPPADGSPDRTLPEDRGASVLALDTGHPRVDEAVARLAELDRLPTAEHAAVYEDVDRRLHGALSELDDE